MANIRIWKESNEVFLLVEGQTETNYIDAFDYDIEAGIVTIKDLSPIYPEVWIALVGEMKIKNGNPIGGITEVENYLAELKIIRVNFTPIDYHMEVPLGNVSGQSSVNKFGANANVSANTKEDVWDGGGIYAYPENGTAPITHIHSSSASDTEPIEIQGLDIKGVLTIQTIYLVGITLTALTTPLWRVFRLKNIGTSDLIGVVDVANSGDTIIYAQINIGNNQTLMSLYTIPKNKNTLLTKYYCTTVDATNKSPTSTRFSVWMRDNTINGVFQLKHVVGIPQGGSMVEHSFDPYPKITELVDIKITALPLDENADVATGFDLILIDYPSNLIPPAQMEITEIL